MIIYFYVEIELFIHIFHTRLTYISHSSYNIMHHLKKFLIQKYSVPENKNFLIINRCREKNSIEGAENGKKIEIKSRDVLDNSCKIFNKNTKLICENNNINHGVYYRYNDNGQMIEESNWNHGVRHGLHIKFDDNGRLKLYANYLNGKKNGVFQYWFKNGKLSVKLNYINGKRIEYYRLKYGKLHGRCNKFNINGKLIQSFYYKDGIKINGTCFKYHDNGILNIKAEYKYGKLHGLYMQYDINNKLIKHCHYKYGIIIYGNYYQYNPEGKINMQKIYNNNVLNVTYKIYNTSDQLIEEINYIDGKLNGSYYKFYDDNKKTVIIIAEYKNGKLHGPYNKYNKNKICYESLFYINGVRKSESKQDKFINDILRNTKLEKYCPLIIKYDLSNSWYSNGHLSRKN